ncbi:procollagen C-endopeptidase enhancer a [Hoplias malabaricus]|uniref:procollagen C-endopeptidase enhancer a n=1 Tax=Hoplias malabaricus TaxID=27720 RepID=UPI0034631676
MATKRKMETLSWTFCFGLFLLLNNDQTLGQTTNYTRPVFNCGGHLEGDSGFVGSEGFPSFYKPDSKCTWYITVPEGNVVMLSFRLFDLEADPLCRYDYVDVYNGHSNMVQKLGRFCGTFRPGALISTSNTMMLEMVSDSGNGGRGFLAYFNGGKPHVDEHQFCGGKLTKPRGTIKTPNWPEKNYPPGLSCSWLITVDPNMVIEVKFDKFDVELDTYCRFDYVAFYNGGEKDDSRQIGKYCGDVAPETIVSNSNVLLVQFVSDLSVTSDGFMASYSSIPRGSRSPTAGSGQSGGSVQSVPTIPRKPPAQPKKPITTNTQPPTTTTTPPTTTTTKAPPRRIPAKPVQPVRRPQPRPDPDQPRPDPNQPRPDPNQPRPDPDQSRPSRPVNPLCPKQCKRDGTIKANFCASEFVITGMVTALSPGPKGSVHATVSIIKAFKAGSLTITQAGETMSVKLVLPCKICPQLRRGQNFILMGQVDEDGRGTLAPGSFVALYKAPHQKILNNLNKQPC